MSPDTPTSDQNPNPVNGTVDDGSGMLGSTPPASEPTPPTPEEPTEAAPSNQDAENESASPEPEQEVAKEVGDVAVGEPPEKVE